MNKATRSDIELAGVKIRGYKLPSNEWVLSLNSLGKVLDKSNTTPMRWIKSEWLESRLGESFTPMRLTTDNNEEFLAVTIPIFNLFIQYWSFKGNLKAQDLSLALMNQSLELRLEASLPETSVQVKEVVNEVIQKYPDIKYLREHHRQVQNQFQMWMRANNFSTTKFHDKLTQALYGLSAKELKDKYPEVFAGDEDYIGICHLQKDHFNELDKLIKMKKYLTNTFHRRRKYFTSDDDYINQGMKELSITKTYI